MKAYPVRSILLAIVVFLLLQGCASTPGSPGYVSTSKSEFDGSEQVTMKPAWIYSSPIKLGLYWNTNMPDSTFKLVTIVKGTHSFASGKSLKFNVDGEIVALKSVDQMTDYETSSGWSGIGVDIAPSNWSSKSYAVERSFARKLVESEEVMIRVVLEDSRVEGEFSTDAPTTARPAFEKFLSEVKKIDS
jgi:hypothetical protein